ncbi:MAG: GAF domain-containing protein [Chloroflexi bacterium]|nr:GAF domain-containing protein [Chloroflexota bacterium]
MPTPNPIAAKDSFTLYASIDGKPELGPDATERERVLSSLPHLARKLTGSDYAALTVMNRRGDIEQMFTSGITQRQADEIGAPPQGHGLLGFMTPNRDPLLVSSVSDHPESSGLPPGHPPMEAMLGVAVEDDGHHAANLYLANRPGGPKFTEADIEVVEIMANLAATALQNSRLYHQEEAQRRKADESSSWLEAVIRQAAVGILVVDSTTGEVLLSSPEASRIVGVPLTPGLLPDDYESAARYFRPDGQRVEPEGLPLHVTRKTGVSAGPMEVICQRPDGRRIPTLISAAPVPAGGAHGGAVIAIIQDVTHLKELDQVKSEFLTMITHDLRGPLATIKGLAAEIAGALDHDDELHSDVEAIDEEIDQTIDLVSNLLDMSRIEAGAYPLDMEVAHMVDMVDDARARAQRSRQGIDRTIVMDVPAGIPPAYCDPGQIGRVLDNLISNALKYSEAEVLITAMFDPETGDIRTEVSDSGIGIQEGDTGSVFDKFFRVTGRHGAGRGAGLGLAICKAISEAHGGEIGVTSEPGKGSTFWFTIPAYTEHSESGVDD